ncbi:tRNA (adenine(58)-N(1))-methyltransferase catalytic subunit TRMT61A [Tetrabaena socialis]|uniref:tRNA (adenine(58)-N(1))-methyltransferase n=1 Tax=Tetrabaena socialis TaxID=47790 RepID=A0A2J7ZMG3_9CHLO|nr:tRNA (adenine(58)-N(1))-methyltransferase catalytic subunit TRMT61A [Tetrabaena socialis]|eukprot:PNH01455.1 tRNA (adenine(58)-N(1))-methyltransferase catalytic subunit TRMT61A [Tetrabaena socialis]
MNFLACADVNQDASTSYTIKEGDCVIVYEAANSMKAVYVSAKGRFESRFGVFKHEVRAGALAGKSPATRRRGVSAAAAAAHFLSLPWALDDGGPQKLRMGGGVEAWIGKPFGCKATASLGGRGWVYLLRPTPELWTQVLRHRPPPEHFMFAKQPSRGFQPRRAAKAARKVAGWEDAAAEFKQHGLAGMVTVAQRNIEELGFPDALHNSADAVFLDLPGPWKVVASAAACLKPNGRFCGFSPCIEQVQRTAEALSASGFTDLITYECLLRDYEAPAAAPAAPEAAAPEAAADPDSTPGEGAGAGAAAGAEGQLPESGAEDGSCEGAAPAEAEAKAKAEGGSAAAGGGGEGGSSPAAGQRKRPGGDAAAPEERALGSWRVVSCRPALEARGHTGYLTFARKFVCG